VDSATERVITHTGSDPDTHEYTIRFRYAYGGREHVSERYGLSGLGTGVSREAFEGHRSGSRATCYLDPADPGGAVMDRSLPWGWGFGIFPLLAAVCAAFFAKVLLSVSR
jgi:hypothetical protein